MRAIDADALKKAMRMWPRTRQPVLIYTGTILKGIDDAPTLDYKDLVPQGEWVNNADDYPECNRCGYMPVYDHAIDDIAYSNFCPNCGARMKGAD
jgi:hypothetical protein